MKAEGRLCRLEKAPASQCRDLQALDMGSLVSGCIGSGYEGLSGDYRYPLSRLCVGSGYFFISTGNTFL